MGSPKERVLTNAEMRPWRASPEYVKENSVLTEDRKYWRSEPRKLAKEASVGQERPCHWGQRDAGSPGAEREGKYFSVERWKKGFSASSLLPEFISRHPWLRYPYVLLGAFVSGSHHHKCQAQGLANEQWKETFMCNCYWGPLALKCHPLGFPLSRHCYFLLL